MRPILTLFASLLLLSSCFNDPVGPEQLPVPPEVMEPEAQSIDISADMLASKKDPVCNMPVSGGIADTASFEGKLYGFCATGCKEAFVKKPTDYLKQ